MKALPRIAPYAMPSLRELPLNRVPWVPTIDRSFLLVHDMQQYFLNAFTVGSAPLGELICNVAALRRHCVGAGIPVCYSTQPGGQSEAERGLLMDFWGPGLPREPDLCRIIAELSPEEGDVVLTKTRYSALYRTGLLDIMKRQRRDQLIICGVYAHIGCLTTALDAFMSGIQAVMVADALGDFSAEDHAMALNYAAKRCAVVLSTEQLCRALSRGTGN
jgi:bifunctional isochorismate lyase/aryl carrier protein